MNIGLIGMPGTMKSSVGKALSALTGMPLVDTDEEFEREEGRSISDVFETDGEAYFRARERAIVARVCGGDGAVISFGGGAPLDAGSRAEMKRGCLTVLLTATPECIAERCSHSDARPLLRGDMIGRVRRLLAERADVYAECADVTVDTTGIKPEEAAEEIAAAVKNLRERGK